MSIVVESELPTLVDESDIEEAAEGDLVQPLADDEGVPRGAAI